MPESEYKKYTELASRGIKGEAFFESLICNHCIPHQVTGPKDIGIDYFCEWINGDRPTGMLFAVQVKTTTDEQVTPVFVEVETDLNGLEKYDIAYHHLRIGRPTRVYWQSLAMPTYVFVVVEGTAENGSLELVCYYKRYTALLTTQRIEDQYLYKEGYYKVSQGDSFLAYKEEGFQGFARDPNFTILYSNSL